MSLGGFKKQLNKANQYVSEKIGGAKGTELDDEFVEMERKIDVMGNLVNELMARTHEHLQPNPASRAKLSAVKSISKLRGQANVLLYPQPEGQLGECMAKFGKDLGDDSLFGQALQESGEAYRQLADIKYGLEDNVKQNFIEPLHHIQTKDLKEVNHHRKKLSGRRLDFDCKRRKQVKGATGAPAGGANVTEEDIIFAEDKFQESKLLAETAMFNLLENDVEQISALASFIEAEVTFHKQAGDVLAGLHETLQERIQEAANRPRREHVPKRVTSFTGYDRTPSPSNVGNHEKAGNNFDMADHSGYSLSPAPPSYQQSLGSRDDVDTETGQQNNKQPCAEALYDFDPENEGELGFKEGDTINLVARIDENWFEGSVNGQTGFFPINYVKVVVDL